MKRLIGILLVTVMLVPDLRAENWMARLPDDALVAEVSIPGAHDAATGSGWAGLYGPIGNKFAKTQDLDLRQLWDVGIRAFDLRPAMHKHYMSLNHGMVPTRLHFDEVLYRFRDWLRDNPSEFIVIHLLHAGDGDKVKDSYETRLQQLLTRLDLRDWLADFRPDLRVGDVRGKMLILSRNRYSDRPVGGCFVGWTGSPDWRRQTQGRIVGKGDISARVYMQDFSSTYAKGALDIKTAAVTRMLDFSTTHRAAQSSDIVWVLNFCSAYSKVARLFGHDISTSNGYRDNAVHTHAAFLRYLQTHKAGPTGIVLMDYAGIDRSHDYQVDGLKMVSAIIGTNWRED
jgi:hypothetical protein